MTELKCKYSGEMCPYVPVALSIRCDECMVKKAYKRGFYDQRPHEKWEYLKEHITEMHDADGELNQKDTCKFILELMGVIEREGEKNDED